LWMTFFMCTHSACCVSSIVHILLKCTITCFQIELRVQPVVQNLQSSWYILCSCSHILVCFEETYLKSTDVQHVL
jgi:hypothetical protein